MAEKKHTRLPWKFAKATGIAAQYGIFSNATHVCIAGVHKIHKTGVAEANAEFITRACNSHYTLIGALQNAVDEMSYAQWHKPEAMYARQAVLKNARDTIARATRKAGS